MTGIKQAVILAGGQGVRLRPLTYTTPKPMVLVNRRPYLEYLIELLKKNGISEVVLLLGYLSEKIVSHFKDGSGFGIRIRYSIGDVLFETGKRIKDAEVFFQERFLLLYSDNYWPLNLAKLEEFHNKNQADATVTVYSNREGLTKNNIYVDKDGFVLKYDKLRQEQGLNGVEIGFFVITKKVLSLMPEGNFSFEKEVLPRLIESRRLAGYLTDHKYYSIGSMDRLSLMERFLQPKKVIFLDRDGVINEKAPKAEYIKSWDEFKFLPGSTEALRLLSENGYMIFIITNQAGIARGIMSEGDLKSIHVNLEKALKNINVKIEGIYYCPHGWDDGCICRKPRAGMFFKAANEHNLDLSKTFFVGDDERDLEAGNAAGCRTFLTDSDMPLLKIAEKIIASN